MDDDYVAQIWLRGRHRRFDADCAAAVEQTGARRRSILIGYFAEPLYASHLATASLRSIRMDTTDRFGPTGVRLVSGRENAFQRYTEV